MTEHWSTAAIPPLKGKLALVTGANRGLGLEIVSQLARAGADVMLGCRDLSKAHEACERVQALAPQSRVTAARIDLADLSSIRGFAADFCEHNSVLDILCHNAGAIMVPSFQKTKDGFELQFGTNYLGAFALTGLLLTPLEAATQARVVSNSSMAHRMAKSLDFKDVNGEAEPYKIMGAYGRSKLASLLFAFELARRLAKKGSRAMSIAAHPGIADTNPGTGSLPMRIVAKLIAQSTAMGALPTLYAATAPAVRNGDFYGPEGFNQLRGYPRKVESAATARDPQLAAALWKVAEGLCGVNYLS